MHKQDSSIRLKKITLVEIKKIQLELLDFLHEICIKNNLNYSLYGGTLLGAVRHQGYIPWDDDIDVLMPRPDYEKFIKVVSNMEVEYYVKTPFITKDYYYPFCKLFKKNTVQVDGYKRKINNFGINIDVFPIDGTPNNLKKRDRYWNTIKKIKRLNTMVYSKNEKNESFVKSILRKIVYFLFNFFKPTIIAKIINKMAIKNDFYSSEYIACSIFGYGRKEEFSAVAMKEFIELPFEGKKYMAMKGYDIYLSSVFGDYMKLPPKEKQVLKHDFEAYLES